MALISVKRRGGSWIVGTFLFAVMAVCGAPASAAPYPPVPPTGGAATPAAGQIEVPSLSVGAIAPGSYPVQARTGTRASTGDDQSAEAIAVVAFVGIVGLGGGVTCRVLRRRGPEPA